MSDIIRNHIHFSNFKKKEYGFLFKKYYISLEMESQAAQLQWAQFSEGIAGSYHQGEHPQATQCFPDQILLTGGGIATWPSHPGLDLNFHPVGSIAFKALIIKHVKIF